MEGYRAQIMIVVGAVLALLNTQFPDVVTPQVENAVTVLVVAAIGFFSGTKYQRKKV